MTAAICAACGRVIPPDEELGRVDIRMRTSERAVDAYGRRKHSKTRSLMTRTLCERCSARAAGILHETMGLEMRNG